MAKVNKEKITMILIKDLKDSSTDVERLNNLYKFIKRMWKLSIPAEVNTSFINTYASTRSYSFDKLYIDLEAYSDNWDFTKLYSVYVYYIESCNVIQLTNPTLKWRR